MAQRSDPTGGARAGAPATASEGSPELLDIVLRSLLVGLCTVDAQGRLTSINAIGEELLGFSQADLAGGDLHQSIHHRRPDGTPLPAEECPLTAAVRLGAPQRGETVFWRRDGQPLPVRYTVATLHDERGGVAGAALTFLDLSEEQRSQVAARRTAEQIAEMSREAQELRQDRTRLLELERIKSDFLNLAAHELRGPLAVALGYVAMLGDGTFGPAGATNVATALPIVEMKLREINLLVNQMLDTARLEEGRLHVQVETVDVRSIVHQVLRVMTPLARDHRLVVVWSGEPVLAVADAARVTTILTNLVDNACKYSAAGSTVEIRCAAAGDEVVMSVRDEGVGIDPGDVGVIFQRFGRVVTRENSHIAGIGLGLYLSRDLARLQGGDITVESRPGQGSVFSLHLPAARGRERAQASGAEASPGTNTDGST